MGARSWSRRKVVAGLATLAAQQSARAELRLPRKVRVVMIGLDAHPGEILDPAPQLPDVEVAGLFDEDAAAVERFARRPQCARARKYTDWRRMLDQEKPDVAGVCNPNHQRAEAVIECLRRGIHVAAEKPLAIEWEWLKKVETAVAQSKAKLTMLLPMRFDPAYKALKQVVDSGEIGEVIHISGQKSYKVSQRPAWYFKRSTYGGTIPWIGIHLVDLMRWTSGRDFTETFSYQNNIGFPETGDTENVTASVFKLDNGGVGLLRMDYLRPASAQTHGDDRLRLAGMKGVVEYMAATGVTVMSASRAPERVDKLPAKGSLFTEFLDHVYNGKPEPISWKDIYRNNLIVLGARDAAEQHKIVRL